PEGLCTKSLGPHQARATVELIEAEQCAEGARGERAGGYAGLKRRPVHRKLRRVNRRYRGAGDGNTLPVLPSGPAENRLRCIRRAIPPLPRLGAVVVVFSRSADC